MARMKRRLIAAAVFLLGVIAIFRYAYVPWQLTWGATADEVSRRMPGDEIVDVPTFSATRGVTVNAPAECVWPWLVQVGYRRAGFYSWDALDNDGVPSAGRIMAEYQGLRVGDVVPLSKDSTARVADMVRERHLLLVFPPDTPATWAWGLYPIDSTRTRLVSRLRVRVDNVGAQLMLDAFELVMMRKHLLGIKRRAEGLGGGCRAAAARGRPTTR
jgi:hypothetical protein